MDDTLLLNDGKAYGTFGADGTVNTEFDSSATLNSHPTENAPSFKVERHALSMVTIDELAPPFKGKQNFPERVHSAFRSSMNFSCECFTKFCKRSFPILTWLPQYSIKNDLLLDVITGVTLLILHVPQGTSRHISIGTFAVASLLAGTEVEEVMHQQFLDQKAREHATAVAFNFTTQSSNFTLLHTSSEVPLPFSRIQVAMVVTFTVGFLQTAMGILRMGALTSFMSDEMISAFVTGTVIHVFTSQLKPLTGVVFMKYSGPFNIILSWIALFQNINSVNYVVLILSLCGIVFLLIIKEGVNAFLLTKIKVPIPAELILVICGTLVSYFLNLQKCCNVDIVGYTPTNLLPPTVPPLQLVPKVLTASMVLSVVCATITLSIVIIYAKKHKYEVDTNQELIAYGVAGLVSAFFFCIPSCASLSRSAVQESTGAKSQIASLVSCALMIVVLLVLGPYFESLPNCILSAVIVVSLKGLLLHFKDLKRAWNTSKLDASVWLVTFLSVVILDMDYGLVIGIVFSLITILFRSQYPETCLLGQLPGTELYRSTEKYPNVHEMPGIKIVHFGASVYFGNRDYFRSQVLHLTNVHKRYPEVQASLAQLEQNEKQKSAGAEDSFTFSKSEEVDDYLRCVILAFSAVAYIDSGGVVTLLQVVKEFSVNNVTVYLACVQEPVLESLESQGFFNTVSQKHIFPTIHDAVLFALSQRTSS